jgi:hypothetical protein
VNPQATDETEMEKRERTVCYKPRNLKHRGITRNQRMAENNTVGSLALPSIDTKMAKVPTYTQKTTATKSRCCIKSFASAWLLTICSCSL